MGFDLAEAELPNTDPLVTLMPAMADGKLKESLIPKLPEQNGNGSALVC